MLHTIVRFCALQTLVQEKTRSIAILLWHGRAVSFSVVITGRIAAASCSAVRRFVGTRASTNQQERPVPQTATKTRTTIQQRCYAVRRPKGVPKTRSTPKTKGREEQDRGSVSLQCHERKPHCSYKRTLPPICTPICDAFHSPSVIKLPN